MQEGQGLTSVCELPVAAAAAAAAAAHVLAQACASQPVAAPAGLAVLAVTWRQRRGLDGDPEESVVWVKRQGGGGGSTEGQAPS